MGVKLPYVLCYVPHRFNNCNSMRADMESAPTEQGKEWIYDQANMTLPIQTDMPTRSDAAEAGDHIRIRRSPLLHCND